jgi:hypothetical protein
MLLSFEDRSTKVRVTQRTFVGGDGEGGLGTRVGRSDSAWRTSRPNQLDGGGGPGGPISSTAATARRTCLSGLSTRSSAAAAAKNGPVSVVVGGTPKNCHHHAATSASVLFPSPPRRPVRSGGGLRASIALSADRYSATANITTARARASRFDALSSASARPSRSIGLPITSATVFDCTHCLRCTCLIRADVMCLRKSRARVWSCLIFLRRTSNLAGGRGSVVSNIETAANANCSTFGCSAAGKWGRNAAVISAVRFFSLRR